MEMFFLGMYLKRISLWDQHFTLAFYFGAHFAPYYWKISIIIRYKFAQGIFIYRTSWNFQIASTSNIFFGFFLVGVQMTCVSFWKALTFFKFRFAYKNFDIRMKNNFTTSISGSRSRGHLNLGGKVILGAIYKGKLQQCLWL